jgi:hypothetical protein
MRVITGSFLSPPWLKPTTAILSSSLGAPMTKPTLTAEERAFLERAALRRLNKMSSAQRDSEPLPKVRTGTAL